jgi:signal transduction histidine kinase
MESMGSNGDRQELAAAYRAYEEKQRLSNTKVGCALVVTLMPAGSLLDAFVYPDRLWPFFKTRLICSALAALIWGVLFSRLGTRLSKWLGVIVPLLPVIFIAEMIVEMQGFASPYYAGLNLVLLAVGAVLHWTLVESVIAVTLVLLIYIVAGIMHGDIPSAGVIANNFYFIALMDVIVVVGTYFQSKGRFREFALRFQLDKNKQMLEESNRKLTEMDQIKGRFFANISHELRTPLTLMISPLESILARYRASLDPNAVSLLQTMQSNGLRLLRLINDLLDLVRLDSGVLQVRREPVAVEQFLQGMTSAACQVAEDKHIQLVVTVAPEIGAVMVDRDKLEKIVLNLQFNALKFTPAGGRVELRAEREGEELVLRVSDTGIGIPEKDLPNVFGRFFQVDSSSRRKFQGVGIGLALVKELTELHGGKVSVQSVEGTGTTFTVRMPYIHADLDAVPAPAPEFQSAPAELQPAINGEAVKPAGTVSNQEWLANLYHRANLFGGGVSDRNAQARPDIPAQKISGAATVLIADDQPDMLRFLQSELASRYNVLTVTDGQQAVDKAIETVPDIILLDMMMPEKDGMQACREIRAALATQNVPIVLVTAHVDEETKLNALRAGASDFLPKPFSTTELHVRVKNLIESHELQRQLAKQNAILESTIEQLKETEMQLVQAEKIASLGRMSAGIIHEINNPLNFATTGLYLLRKKEKFLAPDQQAEYAEVLKDVEEGIGRVKTIVSELRSFTHPDTDMRDHVKVSEVVADCLKFLSNEWKNKIVIERNVPDELTVWVNKNRLIQVVLNLLQNAIDAFKRKPSNGDTPTIWIEGSLQDNRSILKIRDNGGGIDPQHMDKIFDPFFTTKDVGEGMGLGLSICYRIIQEYGGHIRVRSEPGKFSEFALELPSKPSN